MRLRRSGLDILGDIPWSTHCCQFYETSQDLIDTLVPFVKAGLEQNEYCMWVISEPLTIAQAEAALRAHVPDLDRYLSTNQIAILSYAQCYLRDGRFDLQHVLDVWASRLDTALRLGFDGIRITGNTAWLDDCDWHTFTEYEAILNNTIGHYPMIALCTYPLDRCRATEVLDVIHNHHFAIIKRPTGGDIIENAEVKKAKRALERANLRYALLSEAASRLLTSTDPRQIIDDLCRKTMDFLDCHIFLHFLADQRAAKLRLNASAGITPAEARTIQWLDLGLTVDGCVARDGCPIIAEHIPTTPKPLTLPTQAHGIKAYVCHPLLGPAGAVLGTLSFGTHSRETFSAEDLDLIKTVADQVAVAMARHLSEARLRDSEERFRAIYATSPIGIAICDSQGRLLDANKACLDIFGIPDASAIIGSQLFNDPNIPDDAQQRLQSGQIVHYESTFNFDIISQSGLYHSTRSGSATMDIVLSPLVHTENGCLDSLLAQVQDISARKLAETERERLLSELRAVIEGTQANLAVLDRDFNFILVNEAYASGSGLRRQDLIGHNHFALFPNEENEAIFRQVRDTGLPYEVTEKPFQYPNQSERGLTYWNWIIRPIHDASGSVQGLLLSLLDVTAQVRSRQQIERIAVDVQRRAAELDALVAGISEGLLVYDANGHLVLMNSAAERITGFSADDWRAMGLPEQIRRVRARDTEGRPLDTDNSYVQKALAGNSIRGLRIDQDRPDGSTCQLLVSAGPILDAAGHPTGAVVTFTDATELLELQRAQREIASVVAHDLRQPLTAILGYASLIERALSTGHSQLASQAASTLTVSARKMNTMIQDIVDGARTEAGSLELRCQVLDLGQFHSEVLAHAASIVGDRQVHFQPPTRPALVKADPDRLERVILNLLSNALKYSPTDTTVRIAVNTNEHQAVVSVRDHGPGIASEDFPRLFGRFQRLGGGQQKEGIGLGLYISRVFVEAHGGRIWVDSCPGQGSTFSFTLPLHREDS